MSCQVAEKAEVDEKTVVGRMLGKREESLEHLPVKKQEEVVQDELPVQLRNQVVEMDLAVLEVVHLVAQVDLEPREGKQ